MIPASILLIVLVCVVVLTLIGIITVVTAKLRGLTTLERRVTELEGDVAALEKAAKK